MYDAFGRYHPAANFIFFILAIAFGMFFVHPAFLIAALSLSLVYFFLIRGTKGFGLLKYLVPLFVAVTFLNPIFNRAGDTVLFTYFGRSFTREALFYGFATGAMFFSILLWFACYNAIMTSDKFIYMFGKFIPAISLVLSMVLRLVPNFKSKTATIAGARKCIGKGNASDRREKVQNGMDILSVLTSWSLEGGVITADSMRSRGYGSGRRTSYAIYRFERRDALLALVMAVSAVLVVFCALEGGMSVTYIPSVDIPPLTGYTALGLCAYVILLVIPSVIHIGEAAKWRILRSKI